MRAWGGLRRQGIRPQRPRFIAAEKKGRDRRLACRVPPLKRATYRGSLWAEAGRNGGDLLAEEAVARHFETRDRRIVRDRLAARRAIPAV